MIQIRYFNFMVQIKFANFYMDHYVEASSKMQKRINIFLALVSSSAIGGWLIWDKYKFLWAIMIALYQVFTIINKYLQYEKRTVLGKKYIDSLNSLFHRMEYQWYDIAEGNFESNEINELLYKYQKEYIQLERKYLTDGVFPFHKKYKKKADEKTAHFFENRYS